MLSNRTSYKAIKPYFTLIFFSLPKMFLLIAELHKNSLNLLILAVSCFSPPTHTPQMDVVRVIDRWLMVVFATCNPDKDSPSINYNPWWRKPFAAWDFNTSGKKKNPTVSQFLSYGKVWFMEHWHLCNRSGKVKLISNKLWLYLKDIWPKTALINI